MSPSLSIFGALFIFLVAPLVSAEPSTDAPTPGGASTPAEPDMAPATGATTAATESTATESAPAADPEPSVAPRAEVSSAAAVDSRSPEPTKVPRPPARSMGSRSNTQELTLQDRSGEAARTRERPTQVTLSYSTALALGATRDFVGDFSFVGFGLDWHRRFGERLSAGISLGWQVLYDKTRDTTVIDSLTITGVQLRHVNTFPVLLSARFLPRGQSRSLGPYIGLGVGAYPSEWRADIGLVSFSSFGVHFGFAPEVGVQIPTRTLGRLCFGVKYDYAFESAGNPELSYFAFTVGVAR